MTVINPDLRQNLLRRLTLYAIDGEARVNSLSRVVLMGETGEVRFNAVYRLTLRSTAETTQYRRNFMSFIN